MMFFKKYWPCILFVVLVLCIGAVFGIKALLPGPNEAVEGYIKNSLRYNVDGMLFYASEYQLKSLAGNGDIPKETLRNNLKEFYQENGFTGETGKITFQSESPEYISKESQTFSELLDLYSYKGTTENVSQFAITRVTCYVDGAKQGYYKVIAVKIGLRWYYGFINYEVEP